MRNPVCVGTGRNVWEWLIPGGFVYRVKSHHAAKCRFHCRECGRFTEARMTGQRGRWEYRFDEHPRRGVTKGQWAAHLATAKAGSE